MAGWTASAKWAASPALDGQRDMPLALRLSEGLAVIGECYARGSSTNSASFVIAELISAGGD